MINTPQKSFQRYDPHRKYGAIILLAGENVPSAETTQNEILANPNHYPRSKKAAEVLNSGKIDKGILVTGGYGGLEPTPLEISGGERTFNYLTQIERIPDEFLFLDDRSRETLGNFALPAENHLIIPSEKGFKASLNFSELESILLITEEGHMKRALECAEKVIPYWQMDYLAVEGPYKPGLVTKIYHASLMHATRHITKPDSKAAVEFLENEHPFYKHGDEQWFNKPLNIRRIELAVTCVGWYAGTNQKVTIKIK